MTTNRQFKDQIFDQLARISKALAHPKRLELLDILAQAPRTVERLATLSSTTLSNTSQHLQILKEAHLIESTKEGLFVSYRLAKGTDRLYLHLRTLAEVQLAEINAITHDFLKERNALEPVDYNSLLQRALCGEVTILDVRSPEEYRAGHLPGAHSIPLIELQARLNELPPNQEIIAYCRGRYCVLALEATQLLQEHGFKKAHRLETGPLDWREAGVPLETSQ
jgi:rhodanese-related sulfurtransferase